MASFAPPQRIHCFRALHEESSSSERGFALIVVLWVMTFLGIVLSAFAFSMRTELAAARSFTEEAQVAALAEAGVARGIAELLNVGLQGQGGGASTWFYDSGQVALGRGTYRVLVTDEEARININRAPADTLSRLLEITGVTDRDLVGTIVDSILDWRDADHDHRAHGAERDYYQSLSQPYTPRNGELEYLDELALVKGMTREIFDGNVRDPNRLAALLDESPRDRDLLPGEYLGIRRYLTVKGSGRVNINSAHLDVLTALGVGEAEARAILQMRADDGMPDQLPAGSQGMLGSASSGIFHLESVGTLDGSSSGFRIVVVVQNEGGPTTPRLRVASWSEGS